MNNRHQCHQWIRPWHALATANTAGSPPADSPDNETGQEQQGGAL
jgi:hypothetical protein